MSARIDLAGRTFGRLTALRATHRAGNEKLFWTCRCECGTVKDILSNSLLGGQTISCGCRVKEGTRRTHGMAYTKEYGAWCNMKRRCYNRKHNDYPRYGGRGIIVCKRWRNSFANFFSDMGSAPSPEHSLDRIDVNGPYSRRNCRWSTASAQARNRRKRAAIESFTGAELLAELRRRKAAAPS